MPSQRASATVLVALPDKNLQEMFEAVAETDGFRVLAAGGGRHVVEIASRGRPSMIVVSNTYRDLPGAEVVRRLRGVTGAYILVVERGAEEDQRIELLEAGADQILDGRLSPREHRMRLRALLRRVRPLRGGGQAGVPATCGETERGSAETAHPGGWRTAGLSAPEPRAGADEPATAPADRAAGAPSARVLASDGLAVDTAQHLSWLDGEQVNLTRTEFRILVALMRGRPDGTGRLLTKAELVGVIGGSGADRSALRSLEVHVGNLRRKLGESVRDPRWIRTVRSVGYHWLQPVEAAEDTAGPSAGAPDDGGPDAGVPEDAGGEQRRRAHHLRMVN
ncbi:DNA-binding response regulator [Zhihengliuella salsuginis]|uniref:DNA-binding response regulator n=1 Tax=Zhihengliuella salsuginis TaxID=578222 RepID=A0ABQ3GFV1_9MICC|nr:DNA-binding response regulator [Zhihengliuella salsuginis]